MRELTLMRLRCDDAEDWFGDECRLEVYVDGSLKDVLRRSMDDGQTWNLNR